MKLTYDNGLFAATDAPLSLVNEGWRWLKSQDRFVTSNISVAAKYAEYADAETRKRLDAFANDRLSAIRDSAALDADIDIPAPEGLSYRPYQKAGIAFAHTKRYCLIGDAMRLGKTIQAIGVMNTWETLYKVLVVCPATVKYNWERELRKWLVHDLSIGVVEGGAWPDTDVVVINYDLLSRHADKLRALTWDVAVYDECHALKNAQAQRSRVVFGYRKTPGIAAQQDLFLSGSALFKTPIDLWTICKKCDPHGLGRNWFTFTQRYCAPKKTRFGTDLSGASNLEELQFRMRSTFMIRREKTDVVAEIPPMRETVVLPKTGLEKLVRAEAKAAADELGDFAKLLDGVLDEDALNEILGYAHADGVERDAEEEAYMEDGPLATVRRDLALAKLGMCIEHIDELLEDEQKIVVFAHHRDVVDALKAAFPDAAMVYGGMSAKAKDDEVLRFQSDPNCRVFIGNIIAAGQGINLSVANLVAFVELSWVPAEMDQAEERIWDVLKTDTNSILRYVVEDTLDERMVRVLDKRQRNVQKAMNFNVLEEWSNK